MDSKLNESENTPLNEDLNFFNYAINSDNNPNYYLERALTYINAPEPEYFKQNAQYAFRDMLTYCLTEYQTYLALPTDSTEKAPLLEKLYQNVRQLNECYIMLFVDKADRPFLDEMRDLTLATFADEDGELPAEAPTELFSNYTNLFAFIKQLMTNDKLFNTFANTLTEDQVVLFDTHGARDLLVAFVDAMAKYEPENVTTDDLTPHVSDMAGITDILEKAEPIDYAAELSNQAAELRTAGQYDQAIITYTQAINVDPQPKYFFERGTTYVLVDTDLRFNATVAFDNYFATLIMLFRDHHEGLLTISETEFTSRMHELFKLVNYCYQLQIESASWDPDGQIMHDVLRAELFPDAYQVKLSLDQKVEITLSTNILEFINSMVISNDEFVNYVSSTSNDIELQLNQPGMRDLLEELLAQVCIA